MIDGHADPGDAMIRTVGAVAAGLGYFIRFMAWLLALTPLLVGGGLIVYGISCWSDPAAYVVMGIFILLLWPPERRTR